MHHIVDQLNRLIPTIMFYIILFIHNFQTVEKKQRMILVKNIFILFLSKYMIFHCLINIISILKTLSNRISKTINKNNFIFTILSGKMMFVSFKECHISYFQNTYNLLSIFFN